MSAEWEVVAEDGWEMDPFTAAALGFLEVLKELVRAVDINRKNADGWSLLMYACYYDKLEVVQFLVDAGADKSAANKEGRTALMIAAMSGNVEILSLVLEKSLLELKEKSGMTALSLSIEHGHQNAAKILLSMGADPDIVLDSGTPLMTAARRGHFSLAKLLLEHRANPFIVDSNGKNAIDLSGENGHLDVADLMKAHVMAGMGTVQSTLRNLGLEDYLEIFQEKGISYKQLLEMTEEDMKSIGMRKFGPRRKLTIYIKQLKEKTGMF